MKMTFTNILDSKFLWGKTSVASIDDAIDTISMYVK